MVICKAVRGSSGMESASNLLLDFPASRTMRNKCVLSKPRWWWCFVVAASTDTLQTTLQAHPSASPVPYLTHWKRCFCPSASAGDTVSFLPPLPALPPSHICVGYQSLQREFTRVISHDVQNQLVKQAAQWLLSPFYRKINWGLAGASDCPWPHSGDQDSTLRRT